MLPYRAPIAPSLLCLILLIGGCATLPQGFERTPSQAYNDTDDTALGIAIAAEASAHPGQSGFRLLRSGLDAFVARAELADEAQRSIDAQYYLYHPDLTGALFTNHLLKAAERGVRVRLLIDDMALGNGDLGAAALDSQPNIEVRIVNPFSRNQWRVLQFLTRFGSVTRRMHNKSFTVDNQATILGGRNIGDEYFDASPDLAFSDLDVLAIGPVVKEASAVFDLYWNSELSYPVSVLADHLPDQQEYDQQRRQLADYVSGPEATPYLDALRNSDLVQALRKHQINFEWGKAHLVYDPPEKLRDNREVGADHVIGQLNPYFDALTREVIIFSPYFVPGRAGTDSLVALAKRGVRVRILTNSLASSDVGLVHVGYARYRRDLLRGGVELYEMNQQLSREQRKAKRGLEGSSKASLHAKSFVLDRDRIFIGSLNLDPRSVVENTEVGVILQSPVLAGGMAEWFDQNIDQHAFRLELTDDDQLRWIGHKGGSETVYYSDPYTSFWRRLGLALVGLLPIESQL